MAPQDIVGFFRLLINELKELYGETVITPWLADDLWRRAIGWRAAVFL
jgi:hypothetical protein